MVQKIKAIGFDTSGDINVLKNIQIDNPSPKPQDVKVRVIAVSVNPGKRLHSYFMQHIYMYLRILKSDVSGCKVA
jgi:NADPH:quinone reductase-like Zn-dependent oxidoreductase